MAAASANPSEIQDIRRLASDPTKVMVTRTAEYDLMGQSLTKEDICDEIVNWIDAGERVKSVTLRGQHAGQTAFEMKPRINKQLFYIKVTLTDRGQQDEFMLIISAHLDH